MGNRGTGLAAMVALATAFAVNAETLVLQQGVSGYTGCTDKELREQNSNYNAKVTVSPNVMLAITG